MHRLIACGRPAALFIMIMFALVATGVAGADPSPPKAKKAQPQPTPQARVQAAAEPSETESPYVQATARGGAQSGRVYTNDDLKKMFPGRPEDEKKLPAEPASAHPGGEPGDAAPPVPPAGVETALDQVLAQEAARGDQAQRIAAAEQAVTAAHDRVADLEKRRLAVQNPLMPPPKPPEKGEEQWKAQSGPERLAATEQELQTAREELAKAQSELDTLRGGSTP